MFFSVLWGMGVGSLIAIVGSFIAAAIINYFLCIKFLFRHKARWSAFGEFGAYVVTLLIMGTIDYGVTAGLMTLGVSALWSKGWAALIGFVGNFVLRKYFVF